MENLSGYEGPEQNSKESIETMFSKLLLLKNELKENVKSICSEISKITDAIIFQSGEVLHDSQYAKLDAAKLETIEKNYNELYSLHEKLLLEILNTTSIEVEEKSRLYITASTIFEQGRIEKIYYDNILNLYNEVK